MNEERVLLTSSSSRLSPVSTALRANASRKQQQECERRQDGEECAQHRGPPQQVTSSEHEEDQQQQQSEALEDARQHQPPHSNEDHESSERKKDCLDAQLVTECQPEQASVSEQLQHTLPQRHVAASGKRLENKTTSFPRGAISRRRTRRVASVRFDVPPLASSEGSAASADSFVNSPVSLQPPSVPFFSPARVSDAIANVDGNASSQFRWNCPTSVTDSADAVPCATKAGADQRAEIAEIDPVGVGDKVKDESVTHTEGWHQLTGASGGHENYQTGEFSHSTAHVSCQANSRGQKNEKPLNLFSGFAVAVPSNSTARATTLAGKERDNSTVAAGGGDGGEEEEKARSPDNTAAEAFSTGKENCAWPGRAQGRDEGSSPGIADIRKASCTVAEEPCDTNGEKILHLSMADPTGADSATVYREGRRRRKGRAAKDSAGGWRRHSGCGYPKSSESSFSSGWSDKELYDDEQQQDERMTEERDAVHRLSHQLKPGDASASATRKTGHMLSQAVDELPISPAATTVNTDNALSAVDDRVDPVDAAAAIQTAALEAALAINAAAAAASPPEIDSTPGDKAAAASRRRGKAHILMSSTSTHHSKQILVTSRRSTSANVADNMSCGTLLSAAEKANFIDSFTTPGCCHVEAASSRPVPSDSKPSLISQVTQEDVGPAAEDAIEYSSDWSVFRRSTGRCSIVNPGAAVSFIKTANGVWRNVGTSTTYNSSRVKGAQQPPGTYTGGALCAEFNPQRQQPLVARNVTIPPATGRAYYLNAAAVHAAATADAAAYQVQGRSLATRKQEISQTASAVVLKGGRRNASASSDVQQECCLYSSSREVGLQQQAYEPAAADIAKTASLPTRAKHNTGGRQLLRWWWGGRTQEQQQQQPSEPLPQLSSEISTRPTAVKQQCLAEQRQQQPAQPQDRELLPLPSRQQRWSILLPAGATTAQTAGAPFRNGSNSSNTEDAVELERLLQIEEAPIVHAKLTESENLQKEDLEVIVCNIQQVKNFLVKKLRECEAALLATASERDDMEASLKDLKRIMQEKDQQRDAAAKQLQTENQNQAEELKRLREEVTSLRERATAQEQQIQQLQDEGVLLRADVHDRVAASALEYESLLIVIKQLETDKATLEEQAQQLQQALAKSRQQLAGALSRVDELEAFVPPALRGEGPPAGPNGSSSRRSSSTSPITCASNGNGDALRPAWWSRSGRESPQRVLLQRSRTLQQQGRQQQQQSPQQQRRRQQQQQQTQQQQQRQLQQAQQHAPVALRSRREVERENSGTDPQPRKSTSAEALMRLPGSTFDSEGAPQRSTAASLVQPPSLYAPVGEMRPQEGMQQRQHQSQQQKYIQELTPIKSAAEIPSLGEPAVAIAVTRRRSSSSNMPPDHASAECWDEDNDAASMEKGEESKRMHRGHKGECISKANWCATTVECRKPAQLADLSSDAYTASHRRNATDTGGAAGKLKGALTGGVTRMLQQLEQVLTVEERLIIDETGVYTEDGVCLHRRDILQPSSTAGASASLTPHQQKRVQEVTQQHLERKQQKPHLQAKKGSEGKSEIVQTDHRRTEQEEKRFTSAQGRQQERDSVMSYHDSNRKPPRSSGLLIQQSNRDELERRQALQREATGGATAPSNEDLLVVLSDAEENNTTETEGMRLTSSASGRGAGSSNGSDGSSTHAGIAVKEGQSACTQRQAHEMVNSDGKASSASHRLSRSSSAASVGDTVRDAFCSVLQAVHQRAVEVYIHPSSVLPTGPVPGSSARSSLQLRESGLSFSPGGSGADDAAASPGDISTERNWTQQQQRQMQHRNNAGILQTKSARGRGSAWQQLLQRHREAQQMPLFGSTPYPAATMSSSSRHAGNPTSTSNDSHKPNTCKESYNATSGSVDSSTDSENATTAAGARSPILRVQEDSHIQQASQQQKYDMKQNAPLISKECLQASRELLNDTEDLQQRVSTAQQRVSGQQLGPTQQQRSIQQQNLETEQGCGQGQHPILHGRDVSTQQQIDSQCPRCDADAARELLHEEQGEATEQRGAEEAAFVRRQGGQGQALVARSETGEQQILQRKPEHLGLEPVETVLHVKTEGPQPRIDEQQQKVEKVEEERPHQQQQDKPQATVETRGGQQGNILMKIEGEQPEAGDATMVHEQHFISRDEQCTDGYVSGHGKVQRSLRDDEQRTDDHVVGQGKCETVQQNEVCSEDVSPLERESTEEKRLTQQVDSTEQEARIEPQHRTSAGKQHEDKVAETEQQDAAGLQSSRQHGHQEEGIASAQPEEQQQQCVQPRETLYERAEKTTQKTALESHSKSGKLQPQGPGQQQPRPQQKAAQQRAKQSGQRRGGNSKGSGRQRRK